MRLEIRLAVMSLIVTGFCGTSFAQEHEAITDSKLQEDISSLKRDVAAVLAEQRQVIEQLNELKKLLPVSVVQPRPQPPSALGVHRGENFRGDGSARVAIVEYADFECPYCGQFARAVYPQISDKYIKTGKIKYFYRDLPLPGHPHAASAARADRCAGEQGKYWEIHENMFANQRALDPKAISDRAEKMGVDPGKLSECLASDKYMDDIRMSISEAKTLGIEGTPTFFIGTIGPDGDVVKVSGMIAGTNPYEAFASALDAALATKNQEAVSTY